MAEIKPMVQTTSQPTLLMAGREAVLQLETVQEVRENAGRLRGGGAWTDFLMKDSLSQTPISYVHSCIQAYP